MCYDKALRILARLEYPRACFSEGSPQERDPHFNDGKLPLQQGPSKLEYEQWVDRLVEKKFCHIVSAQVRCERVNQLSRVPASMFAPDLMLLI